MDERPLPASDKATHQSTWAATLATTTLLMMLLLVYAGDAPPMVNEAHYLVKAKNFWQPDWCRADLFASSGKAHTTFYALFGWPTKFVSLEATAWFGRVVGWLTLAIGLRRLCARLFAHSLSSIVVTTVWIAGVEYGNLAGEWVVGGIEAKVPAYGLVLMGLAELVDRRWNRVWLYMGAASAMHVLTGGWAVVAAMIAWLFTEARQPDRKPLITWWLFVGGAMSLLGLLPAVGLNSGASGEDATAAARIYTYFRIRHHLLPSDFYWDWYLRHGITLSLTFAATVIYFRDSWNLRRLYGFTLGAFLIAVGGMIVGALPALMPDLAAKLLRFYWFRLSDAIVPLLLAVLVMRMLADQRTWLRLTGAVALMIAAGLVGHSVVNRANIPVPPSASNGLLGWDMDASTATQRQTFVDWLKVCQWAKQSTPNDEVFLTPRHQQTFKWYAERAEVVNWKDVPQDAKSLFQWSKRFSEIFPDRLGNTRVTIGYRALRQYRKRFGVRFMIVDRRVVGQNLPLVRVYPLSSHENRSYAIYELPR